jgi:hypothetical protein
MLMLKRIPIPKIAISVILIFFAVNCSKDQNSFLPYTKVDLYISLANYNHLTVSGNSILFKNAGYKGVIVVCVSPDQGLYYAYDACCPYETDYSGVVEIEAIKNLTTPDNLVYSSSFYGICNKCGSKFNLMANGQPVSGSLATHYLQNYSINVGSSYLTVTH